MLLSLLAFLAIFLIIIGVVLSITSLIVNRNPDTNLKLLYSNSEEFTISNTSGAAVQVTLDLKKELNENYFDGTPNSMKCLVSRNYLIQFTIGGGSSEFPSGSVINVIMDVKLPNQPTLVLQQQFTFTKSYGLLSNMLSGSAYVHLPSETVSVQLWIEASGMSSSYSIPSSYANLFIF